MVLPGQVTGLTAVPRDRSVRLSWNALVADPVVTDYRVEYRAGSSGDWVTPAGSFHTNTTETILGLTNGTSYSFRVQARNSEGVSASYSAEVTATPNVPSTSGKVCIFRLTNSTDTTEAEIDTDKVELDEGSTVNPARLISCNWGISRSQTDNDAPDQEIGRHPDVGFRGARVTLVLYFNPAVSALNKITQWMTEEGRVAGLYREGRFGLRNDYSPHLNLTPENFRGYKLLNFDAEVDIMYGYTRGTLVLEFSGNPNVLSR